MLIFAAYSGFMQFSFSYDKKKVIQALRYHFISRSEIKWLIILVNVFAIVAAGLYYFKKISPQPFLLSSFLWLMLMVSFWFILPGTIYRKAQTFKESFTIFFYEKHVRLQNERGFVDWDWSSFSNYFESPNFFHLYFTSKSFFLIPKDNLDDNTLFAVRDLLKNKIVK